MRGSQEVPLVAASLNGLCVRKAHLLQGCSQRACMPNQKGLRDMALMHGNARRRMEATSGTQFYATTPATCLVIVKYFVVTPETR